MTYRLGIGWYFNPLSVAQYTLALYAGWVKGDTTAYNRMLANADWLYNNSVVRVDHIGRSFRTYEYNFPQPIFRTPAGWHSALTDATAISALFAVTSASGNSAFAERAKEILLPFEVLLADGGSRTILADRETVWYEEVAHREAPSTRILNGHIYTISLLEWYGEQALNSQAQRLARQGMRGLQYALHLYDDNGFSLYDLYTDLYTRTHNCKYHTNGHIPQMKFLYQTTGIELFDVYAKRWSGTPCSE